MPRHITVDALDRKVAESLPTANTTIENQAIIGAALAVPGVKFESLNPMVRNEAKRIGHAELSQHYKEIGRENAAADATKLIETAKVAAAELANPPHTVRSGSFIRDK